MDHNSMSGRQAVLMDQRGRISFPAGYRASIGEVLYISPDQNFRKYLVVRSKEGYDAELARIDAECRAEGMDQEDIDDELRDFAKDTSFVPADKNGRITLPAQLVQYAGLSGKVVVVGVGEYAEIWDETQLLAYEEQRRALKAKRRAKKDAEKAARLAAMTSETE